MKNEIVGNCFAVCVLIFFMIIHVKWKNVVAEVDNIQCLDPD